MFAKIYLFIILLANILFADPSFSPLPSIKIKNLTKYNLGKRLFFDKNLSSNRKISCASCHIFRLGGADNKSASPGINGIKDVVNTPTIFNTKFNISQDWIGGTKTIKQRSKISFFSKNEMNGNIENTLKYINSTKDLKDSFTKVYKDIKGKYVFDSIAYYVQNLLTPNSKFDKFLKGNTFALNKKEKEGYRLFKGYGCASCHNGVNIGGNMYQKFGIFYKQKRIKNKILDNNLGRYKITKQEYDKHVFKVPSLRNISKTSPYLHNGKIKDLKKIIILAAKYQLGVSISKDDASKIELFLKTLNGEIPDE